MEKKTWFKPPQDSSAFKNDQIKRHLKKSGEPSLVECLYLDTADMGLFKNDAAFMIVDKDSRLMQMAVLTEHGMEAEYETMLPDSGVDLSLFPQDICQKLCGILNNAPLQIFFISAFEEKRRILELEGAQPYLLVRMLGHFEDGNGQGEICALSLNSLEKEDAGRDLLAKKLLDDGVFKPCLPPWIDAMRLRSSGVMPSASDERIRKTVPSALARVLIIRLFSLVRAYVALDTQHFEKASVHMLRVEARKIAALIEAFAEVFGEKAVPYTAFIKKILDETDEIRAVDLLIEALDTVMSLHSDFNFQPLQERLAAWRTALCRELQTVYYEGGWADRLAAFWVEVHERLHQGFDDEEMVIVKASEKIRDWTVELNVYKKAELNNIKKMHEYRKTVRKLRYVLESLSDMVQKRLLKAITSCYTLQDEFGMVGDMAEHIKTMRRLAEKAGQTQVALLCGVCCGVFAEKLPGIQSEALCAWKACRNDLKALEDTL